ncbi:MAG: protein kinase [Myxococcales bacterium]|nr:protein kinase [Myxococcales bacterium]
MGSAPELVEAQKFGKYSLVAKLATGGMAEIFLARLQGAAGFEKLVCVKRLLPHLAKDQSLVTMFMSEARIAAQISHHNVCSVFELGEIDGKYFIAMEYLEGLPFSCFRRRDMYPGHPDPGLIAGLGLQACEGLHHAHQLKRPDGTLMEVVHRDVSANNLFATVDGVVKVLDFGIAKVQDASVRTSTGSVKGTYAYMAPEQLRGERLDRRTDVFALGTVLWELFARQHLFKRETDFLTFQAITSDPIPDVCEIRPDIPPELGAVIAQALSRDREERFMTTRALGEALSRSVASIGGPWSAAQISEEIVHSFEARLDDQRRLIRTAREGGAYNLDADLGPSVGHGSELTETPVSHVSGQTPPPISVTPSPARRSAPMVAPQAPRSATLQVPPAPARRFPIVIVLVALLALAGGPGDVLRDAGAGHHHATRRATPDHDRTGHAATGGPTRCGGRHRPGRCHGRRGRRRDDPDSGPRRRPRRADTPRQARTEAGQAHHPGRPQGTTRLHHDRFIPGLRGDLHRRPALR